EGEGTGYWISPTFDFLCIHVLSVLVQNIEIHTAEVGDTVILPCYIDPTVAGGDVFWRDEGDHTVVDIIMGKEDFIDQSSKYKGRVETFTDEIANGNFSIMLSNVNLSDSTIYTCNAPGHVRRVELSVNENQMPDNAGEIRLWRNLFITLGMVIGVVVLAVTENQTSTNDECQDQMPDKSGEIRLWRNLFITLGMVIGVVVLAVTENQTSTNDECQDQMPDKSGEIRLWRNLFITLGMVIGVVVLAVTENQTLDKSGEIRLWRNLFITLGMVIGVVVLAVTVSITSCCGKTKSPNCDVELLEVTGTQIYLCAVELLNVSQRSRSLTPGYSNTTFKKRFSLQYNSSLFIHNISTNELGVYYCIQTQTDSPPDISSGIRLYIQNHSAENQTSTNDECQDQMPDKSGEIRLWRNLFITLGMVIGVVVLAVTVSITSCCGKTKSPNCDVELLEVTGTQSWLPKATNDSSYTVVEFHPLKGQNGAIITDAIKPDTIKPSFSDELQCVHVMSLVQCVHVVHSVAGETVTLPCPTSQIKLDGHNVYWRFNDSMTVCDIIRGEVDFDEQHAMYKGKVKYFPGELKGNFSIQLLDVNSAHHGIYTCIIPNVATEMVYLTIEEKPCGRGGRGAYESRGKGLLDVFLHGLTLSNQQQRFFFFRLFPSGVATANHLSPPIPIFCILNTCTH
ncbi:hypothetical protein QTP70_025309, partial [Hemibagrus guttatus]